MTNEPSPYDPTDDPITSECSEKNRGHHFRLLARGMTDYALVVIDVDGRIVQWNSGAETIFGFKRRDVIGKPAAVIFTAEDRRKKLPQREMETAAVKGRAQDKRWHKRKDGTLVWVDGVMTSLRDENGQLRGFAKIARDDTQGKNAEGALSKAQRLLERRVRARTAELTETNKKLREEIAQRRLLEQEILTVSEREKRRIGQDLHDSLCQELAAAALFLQTAAQKIGRKNPSGAKVLTEAARIVNDNVGLARDLARGLHPVELTSSGLSNALQELAFRTSQTRAATCRFECPRQVRIRDEAVALNLYRIAQEAVANAIKNGKATEIVIKLVRVRRALILSIEDNGKGFSTDKPRSGMGLHIMNYRASVIGASLKIESRHHHGTTVTCTLSGE